MSQIIIRSWRILKFLHQIIFEIPTFASLRFLWWWVEVSDFSYPHRFIVAKTVFFWRSYLWLISFRWQVICRIRLITFVFVGLIVHHHLYFAYFCNMQIVVVYFNVVVWCRYIACSNLYVYIANSITWFTNWSGAQSIRRFLYKTEVLSRVLYLVVEWVRLW